MPYSVNTIRRAEQILGYGITDTTGEREFTLVDGIFYTDLFTGNVTIPGFNGTIKKAFNGRVGGTTYFNEVHISGKCPRTVAFNLSWGSAEFMNEIDELLSWLNTNDPNENLDSAGIKSKKIEDFSVTKGTAAETNADVNVILHEGYGYYIRRPLIISVSKEHRSNHAYF